MIGERKLRIEHALVLGYFISPIGVSDEVQTKVFEHAPYSWTESNTYHTLKDLKQWGILKSTGIKKFALNMENEDVKTMIAELEKEEPNG
jgi:hypothetical protein